MSKRNRHGRYHSDLREIGEGFEQAFEQAVHAKQDSKASEALRVELQEAKDRIAELEARCLKRWSTTSLVLRMIGTAVMFGGVGYLVRLFTS